MKSNFLLLALASALFLMTGCVTDQTEMGASPKIPAAEGLVNIRDTSNENTHLDLIVKHLAEPSKMSPDASTYVVWSKAMTENSKPQNLGALMVGRDLSGKLSTVTPLRNFELFVTAEATSEAQQPSGEHLLWAKIIH